MRKKVPVPGKKTLVPDSASSEGRAIRQVEILSNKLLTTAFEASLGKKVPDPGKKVQLNLSRE